MIETTEVLLLILRCNDIEFDFRDGFTNTALPIILVSFEATKVRDQVRLTWVTSAKSATTTSR